MSILQRMSTIYGAWIKLVNWTCVVRLTDWEGGMVIVKAEDKEQAIAIAKADLFVELGTRRYEGRTWRLSCEENNHLGVG
mgnify:CR=1 FL=1